MSYRFGRIGGGGGKLNISSKFQTKEETVTNVSSKFNQETKDQKVTTVTSKQETKEQKEVKGGKQTIVSSKFKQETKEEKFGPDLKQDLKGGKQTTVTSKFKQEKREEKVVPDLKQDLRGGKQTTVTSKFKQETREEKVVPDLKQDFKGGKQTIVSSKFKQEKREEKVVPDLKQDLRGGKQTSVTSKFVTKQETKEEKPNVMQNYKQDLKGGKQMSSSSKFSTKQETKTEKFNFPSQPKQEIKGAKLTLSSKFKQEPREAVKQEQVTPEPVTVQTSRTVSSSVVENGIDEPAKDPNVFRETKDKEEIRFDEMSSIKTKFESGKGEVMTSKVNVHDEILGVQGGEFENEPVKFEQWQNTTEGGVYENQPQENPDVFKESQKNIGEELPEVGMAKNVLHKFEKIQEEGAKHQTSQKRQLTPDRTGKTEYVSEPRSVMEKPQQVVQAGVFESNPAEPIDVVRASDALEDQRPEEGYAKNVLAKFKQYESEMGQKPPPTPGQRELTPDRFTKGEYVSEPRNTFEPYQNPVESGEFESKPQDVGDVVKANESAEEVLPEKGTALSLVSKFKQYEAEMKSPPSPTVKRELTPDRNTKMEYVSEPRGYIEQYEGKSEAGVFESDPQYVGEVVKSGEIVNEPLPEAGYAKNVANIFKELEKTGGSPSSTPKRMKEFTPPKEDDRKGTVAGVLENTPEDRPDVVKSSEVMEAELPERGMAKNMMNKFKELQSSSPVSPRQKKEFTPPPDKGVFENVPEPSLQVEVREAESGILESQPQHMEGIARETQESEGDTMFPEAGYAKNMVSKWKQLESESGKASPSPNKYKEFTPPRDRGPLSPKSPAGMNSSVQPSDLPGQYQEQVSAGVFENTPEHRDDILRESDTNWEEGLPARDTTKSLLQRFKSIQEEAKEAQQTPQPISKKEDTPVKSSPAPEQKKMFDQGEDTSKKSSFVAVQLEKCAACQKTVYALEKVEINNNAYHKACFRCSQCKSTLTAKSFSVNEGTIYCTNHFKQLFKLKGNYDEGFGRHQYKKRWGEEHAKNEQSQKTNGEVQEH